MLGVYGTNLWVLGRNLIYELCNLDYVGEQCMFPFL